MYNNRGGPDGDVTMAAMGCCCCVSLIGLIILLVSSFSSLHTTQYGLDYDHIFETVDKHVYTGGLHFLGIGHNFVKFPNTVQSIVYSQAMHDRLHARTNDGLPLILGVSFQYRLDEKQIHEMYMAFKDQHPKIVFNTGKHLIANAAANYSAYEFFNNKQGIAKDMLVYTNKFFNKHLFCYLDAFQINSVHLPDSFESAIQDSLNMKQNITRTTKLVANVQVQLQTTVLVAHKNAESTIAKAEGDASAVFAKMSAAANMTFQTVGAAIQGLSSVKASLGLKTMKTDTNAAHSEMLSYVYNDALSAPSMANMQFLVGSAPGTYINAPAQSSSRI
jgi:hypothetical protein